MAALARLVQNYRNQYPGRPVHLIGHSGGAAVAIWTLEALPPDCPVNTSVLFGSPLSPSYSLAAALRNTAGTLWHFWSPLDLVFLMTGTLLVGTADGRHSVAAGFTGFALPRDAGPEEAALYRDRLRQQRYRPGMLGRFHWGGHFGWANRVFVAEAVAPLLGEKRAFETILTEPGAAASGGTGSLAEHSTL